MASDGETTCANDPNFAAIYSFLKVFGKEYGLQLPSIVKLQEFIENTEEVSDPLKELHLRLLRRALKSAHSNRWEKCMIKFCHQQGHHQEAWEIERFSYKKASTQVKLKVLKFLLEFQFTCHPKFKNTVNTIPSKELRLDPIGRDKNGCVYWLQVDDDANLSLYKEDQDEETWQLIARNREELVKVIAQLKSGEEISPSACTDNDASSGPECLENPPPEPQKAEVEDDEEFLSPESESEHEELDTEHKQAPDNESVQKVPPKVDNTLDKKQKVPPKVDTTLDKEITVKHSKEIINESNTEEIVENVIKSSEIEVQAIPSEKNIFPEDSKNTTEDKTYHVENKVSDDKNINKQDVNKDDSKNKQVDVSERLIIESNHVNKEKNNEETESDEPNDIETKNDPNNMKENNTEMDNDENSNTDNKTDAIVENQPDTDKKDESKDEVSEAIEEPLMVVTGEGNGADCDSYFLEDDCESYFLGEEITDPIMYFYGEGCGYDNDTGNPEAIAKETDTEEENESKELVNGEHESTTKIINVKLKPVTKRTLKKQPNDSSEANPNTKKPCVRDLDSSYTENDLKREATVNDKSPSDSESPKKNKEARDVSPRKNNVKKRRSKVKKKGVARKIQVNDVKETVNSAAEIGNHQDKTSIIEKRKSSVSSVDQDELVGENKEKSPDKEFAVDPLPPKKLRLDTTPESDDNATHSKATNSKKADGKDPLSDESKDPLSDDKDTLSDKNEKSLNDSISKRKKIKAHKGRFKRKSRPKDVDKNDKIDKSKKGSKSLKRTLVVADMGDKNKSESQSESEDDVPITSGKRLKIKPKKIMTSTRKKVEAKLLEKHSSDESEEETLYSLAGKKNATKKLIKKKSKSKDKTKATPQSEDSDTPVRQSRRIAQQKIREEAERRHQEEVALKELKMIHKKKGKDDDDEEEWRAPSGRSSSEDNKKRKPKTWRASDSTGPEPDSDSDSPLFEHHEQEPELDYDKSDHEFSPESDLETDETAEPLRRVRTLQEEEDDGFCKKCGSAEQPEWILLCEKCDEGYHASCLKPLLFYVPDGKWYCPPCNHEMLIAALESELVKLDELATKVEVERARKKLEEPEPEPEKASEKTDKDGGEDSEGSSCSSWSSGSSGGVYRLRARRQLPVSARAIEYDRLISAAIKEEYVEPTTSAGNQGRGKDISTIIEAAEEEKMKAEREAIEQGKPVESKKSRKKQRKKPRKLNSLDVPSEDDDETDEDFKDTGAASSSEDISSSAEKDTGSDSRSSDNLPIRRTGRSENKKDRPKMAESSPEVKKKKSGGIEDSSSESAGAKEWATPSKPKTKSHHHHHRSKDPANKRDKSKKSRRSRGLTQYDADGNVVRARVTYGGLSADEGENDWSPKHRTRQKKINYTEMPNTESEDEMHKSSGKHMPDSSDEFKVTESSDSDWDAERKKQADSDQRMKALNDLVRKTAVVPLEKLPDHMTKINTSTPDSSLPDAKPEEATPSRPLRGKGSRGGRGSRGPRGRGGGSGRGGAARSGSPHTDDALAKLVGVKVKELGQDGSSPMKPNQVEREKKRQEREAKLAEKEAKRQERQQKKEEKEKLKEQKAKEREEKKVAKLALQESRRVKKEKEYGPSVGYGPGAGGGGGGMGDMFQRAPGPQPYHDQRLPPTAPRLQVRAELRGMLSADDRGLHSQQHNALREGTLSVAGSPQPFKPVSEEPSIITRMPHMINQQYRGPMMYPNNSGYGPRGPQNMYQLHPGLGGPGGPPQGARQYPPQYYRLPPYGDHPAYRHHMQGASSAMHHGGGGPGGGGGVHHAGGFAYRGPPPPHPGERAPPDPAAHQPHNITGPGLHPPTTIGSHLGPMGQRNPLEHGPDIRGPNMGHQYTPPPPQRGTPDSLRNPHLAQHLGPPDSLRRPELRGPNLGPPTSHGMQSPLGPDHRGPNHVPPEHRGPNPQSPLNLGGPPGHSGPPGSHGLPDSHRGPPNLGPPEHRGPNPQSPLNLGGPGHIGPPGSHSRPPGPHGIPDSHRGPSSLGPPDHRGSNPQIPLNLGGPGHNGPSGSHRGPPILGPPDHRGPNPQSPLNLGGPGNNGPPASHSGPPSSHGGPPGQHGMPDAHRPPGSLTSPPGSHGPHETHRPPGTHCGPPDHRIPPSSLGEPPRPSSRPSSHGGPPDPHRGHPGSHGGPPDHNRGPPELHRGPPGSHSGLPALHGGPPDHHRGPPGALNDLHRGPLGQSDHNRTISGPPNHFRGPPGSQGGIPDSHRGPPGSHGPPDSDREPPGSHSGPPDSKRGPPDSHVGPPDSNRGPPGLHGPPDRDLSESNRGLQETHRGPLNLGGPPGPHSGPSGSHSGPPGSIHRPPDSLRESPNQGATNSAMGTPPSAGPSGLKHAAASAPGPPDEPPLKIKAEVKTEPEYRSPPTSPGETVTAGSGVTREEPPRHPKIKHTENKDRRPRFPLGPYAPHYASFGPYAPHYAPEPHHTLQQYLTTERASSPSAGAETVRPYLAHLRPFLRAPAPPIPSHLHHPTPNQPNGRPPSPLPINPPPSSHAMTRPPTPVLAHASPRAQPPQAHSHPISTHMQAHPARSPLHQPYAQSQVPPQSPSPHMMQQTAPPHPARTSPHLPYPYDRRQLTAPQPIPRESIPPHSPPRREFDPPRREFPESPSEIPRQVEADSTIAIKAEPALGRVKEEPSAESGVFGGLVSYFSSQHDDIDA